MILRLLGFGLALVIGACVLPPAPPANPCARPICASAPTDSSRCTETSPGKWHCEGGYDLDCAPETPPSPPQSYIVVPEYPIVRSVCKQDGGDVVCPTTTTIDLRTRP